MGAVNRTPSMKDLLDEIDKRVTALERSRRFTIPVVQDWTHYPWTPQSGDLFMDARTGFVFVFCVDGDCLTTASLVYTTGSATFTVDDLRGFKPNQTVAVVAGTTGYCATVASTFTPVDASGTSPVPGTIEVAFFTPSVVPTGTNTVTFSAGVPGAMTFPVGTNVTAHTWRQVMTSTDMISKFSGTLGTSSFSGLGSTVGTMTGGKGEIIAINGYSPHNAT